MLDGFSTVALSIKIILMAFGTLTCLGVGLAFCAYGLELSLPNGRSYLQRLFGLSSIVIGFTLAFLPFYLLNGR
jgi:hypothetical protein